MNRESIQAWYQENISKNHDLAKIQQKRSNYLSLVRLAVFFLYLALMGISIYFRSGELLVGATLIFGMAFSKLINVHNRVKAKKAHYALLTNLNVDEIKRLSMDLHDFPEGSQYIDAGHAYCLDLDLFGSHSLFQWLNRTVTRGGEALLAKSLLNRCSVKEILSRQEAVKELSSAPQWGQDFLARGLAFKGHDRDIDSFLAWVSTVSEYPKWFKPALVILPALAVGSTIAFFGGVLSGYLVLGILVINSWILYRVNSMAADTYNQTHKSINTLKAFEAMISSIEESGFDSRLLKSLRLSFVDKQERASVTIGQLKKILSRIEVRQNLLYWLFNPYFLLDIIWLIQARNWKLNHGEHISHWFESLSKYEVLVSLGLMAHSQSSHCFPALVREKFQFSAKGIGHPLISEHERVSNHFELVDKGTVVVLTGSNMSGKSTFLRTLGVNVVLAGMGATVCAESLTAGDFSMFTSMRTTDSLEQHVSSFYAELERISQLIKTLDLGTPTLFLLDELLKGTNSHDRNIGSTALIKQLRKAPAFGLISTHDLSLGALSEHYDNVENFSFNSELNKGKLSFDYKLQPGICKSFNASELMSQMGIDLKKDPSAY